jgi:hypothetical protein
MRDFKDAQDCPDEEALRLTWPELREQLKEAARGWGTFTSARVQEEEPAERKLLDLSIIIFPMPLAKPQQSIPAHPGNLPSWRRFRLAA